MLQGLKFEIIPSTFEEDLDKSRFEHPWQYAMETARQKANDIATLTAHDEVGTNSLTIEPIADVFFFISNSIMDYRSLGDFLSAVGKHTSIL